MKKEDSNTSEVPKELKLQLESFKKKLWIIKVTESVLAGTLGIAISFLLLFFLERFIELPVWLRAINFLVCIVTFAFILPFTLNKWVFKHRRKNQIAQLIAKKFPHLGDQILGVIELEEQNGKNISSELRTAAMKKVSSDVQKRDLSDALPSSNRLKLSLSILTIIILIAVSCIFLPIEGLVNSLKRWATPWSDTQRFTFTKIDLTPYKDGFVVAKNEPFDLELQLKKGSRKEIDGMVRLGKEPWKKSYFSDNAITFPFLGKTQKANISINIGDVQETITLYPTARPILKKTYANITWPEYLKKADEKMNFSSGVLQPIIGSKVRVIGEVNKKLSSAELGKFYRSASENEIQVGLNETFVESDIKANYSFSENIIEIGNIPVIKDILKFSINWKDIHGLEAKNKATIRIEPQEDEAPTSQISSKNNEIIKLLDHPVTFNVSSSDDHAIKEFGFSWKGFSFENNEATKTIGEQKLYSITNKPPYKNLLNDEITFDPASNSITKPQTIVFQSWSNDQLPGRERQLSQTNYIVHFYSQEMMIEHNNQILEGLKDQAENILEKSIENIEKLENLKKLEKIAQAENDTDKLQNLVEEAQKLSDYEKELSKDITKLTEETQKLFEQAAQDKTLNKESLKDVLEMQQALEKANQKKEDAQKNLEKSAEKMQDQQPKSSEENADSEVQKNMAEANSELEEAAEELEKAINKAKSAKEKNEAETFVNRLKQLSALQRSVHNSILKLNDYNFEKDINLQIGGSHFDELTKTQKSEIGIIYQSQKVIKKDLEWIYEDMTEYFKNTTKPEIGSVIKSMTNVNARIPLRKATDKPIAIKPSTEFTYGMEALISDLESSLWFSAIQDSYLWANEMDLWAKILNNANNQDGGGGGGGGGGGSMSDEDFNFLLRTLEMVKEQQIIRSKTRALEQQKRKEFPQVKNQLQTVK